MKSFSSSIRSRALPEVSAVASLKATPGPAGHCAWFAKPAPRFFRTRTLVRVRFTPLRSVLAGS